MKKPYADRCSIVLFYLLSEVSLPQPLLDACSCTWIAGTHHASVVHNHSFTIDDEEMWKAVYVELIVHFVDIDVILHIIGHDMFDARYMHFVFVQYLFKSFPIVGTAYGDEGDVFWIVLLPEFLQRLHLCQTGWTPRCPEVQINHLAPMLFQQLVKRFHVRNESLCIDLVLITAVQDIIGNRLGIFLKPFFRLIDL